MTVYPSYPSATDSWLVKGCATNWKASTIYREIVTATSAPSSTGASQGASVPTSTPTATGSSTGTAAKAGSEPTSPPTQAASSSPSQAWIAGAVVGPLAAVAILGALAFWLGKRKGKNSVVQPGPPDAGPLVEERAPFYPVPGGAGGAAASYYYSGHPDAKPGFVAHDAPSPMSGSPSPATTYGYPQSAQGPYSPAVHYPGQFPGQQPGPPDYSAQYGQPPVQYPAQLPAQLQGSEVFPNPANAAELSHEPLHR